ncbi:Na+/H+ antiporter subunit D [Thauera aromatica]|uniref:proton-conducting transporter transmembrane domain-containing protein n=1 Tax=Thauera aromatica TaxID=59405 RepID=UPI001FFC2EA4|nr:proton-conducting transporter membrane subunit [Thauera aromatica]MCK2089633.1 Na+/H+ antiporter subunit D [Thauera aromatica]
MNTLIVAPLLIPLATLVLTLLARRSPRAVSALSLAGALALAAAGLVLVGLAAQGQILATQAGGWAAPYGITLVIDRLSAVMVAITGIVGAAVIAFALARDDDPARGRNFHPLVHGLLVGVCGAFVTGDVFNLYVWFEVLLAGSFALLVLGGGKRRLAGTVVYMVLNLVATLMFLLAAGMLYGASGSLNMALLAQAFAADEVPASAHAAVVLMLTAFSIKAALFPVFGWLPASYHVAWPPVSALFAGLLTKVGVYALIRSVTLFWPEPGIVHEVLLWVACATMLIGVLGAAAQVEVRRILSFHIVSQVGYMILGLALATPLALAGAIFYLIHHIVVKANLFLIGGIAAHLTGSERLAAMGGLYARTPGLALLFAIPALSLAGIPPLSGFWAKFALVRAALDAGAWSAAAVALATGLLTLLSMSKIWNEAFLKPHPAGHEGERSADGLRPARWVVSALAAMTVAIGLAAGPVMDYAVAAADQLGAPAGYIAAATGDGGH